MGDHVGIPLLSFAVFCFCSSSYGMQASYLVEANQLLVLQVFGSEYDETTASQTLLNQRASRATVREVQQGGSRVPEEVAILCQEIVEV